MSDLKYQSVKQLKTLKLETEAYISNLKTQLTGQQVRPEWINRYIFQKTPKEMTFAEIEEALGHKVIIK